MTRLALLLALAAWPLTAQPVEQVLVVVNDRSPLSRSIGEYYARSRGIPAAQVCRVRVDDAEEIDRLTFDESIATGVERFLRSRGWTDRIHYIVTTGGVPLKIRGTSGLDSDAASVDSELAALYQDLRGRRHRIAGPLPNPYYQADLAFAHPDVPIYMVTRLAGYTFADVRGLIDRARAARNRGVVVLDLRDSGGDGNDWLREAARQLPAERVVLEESAAVARGVKDVIGYASWGSNDQNRRERFTGLQWLPGALAAQFVSTDARTFREPPPDWSLGKWNARASFFGGSPQSLTADLIREGATGASGHVYEPFLAYTPRPRILFNAYLVQGRNLAESFYAAMPAISWMNVVVGDPLCRVVVR